MTEHVLRITTSGSVSSYATSALSFLSDDPHTPVVLTTRPDGDKEAEGSKKGTLHPSTLAAPRLVSVVEMVKRRHPGLWQYNESGLVVPVAEERPSLERVLEGKTKPKMTHSPYLQITLSTRPLGLETRRNVTCQRGAKEGKGQQGKKKAKGRGKKGGAEGEGMAVDEVAAVTEVAADGADLPLAATAVAREESERRGKRKSEAGGGASKRARR